MGIRFIPDKTNFKFVNKRIACILLSLGVILGTCTSLYIQGLNFGIDFSGGVIMEIKADKPVDLAALRGQMVKGVNLQSVGTANEVIIRIAPDHNVNQADQIKSVKAVVDTFTGGGVEYRKVDFVGPQVGDELIRNATLALLLSFAAMFTYIWFRFEWQYGSGALLAIIHDAFAVVGFYSITRLEFDLTSIAAILTVIGYSMNDTVVIYDRVRENVRKYKKMPFGELIDFSINETLSRTIMTAGTTTLALISLSVFGGEVIRSFSLGMLFGVFIGTYSSIYVSAVLLIYLDPRKAENNVGTANAKAQ